MNYNLLIDSDFNDVNNYWELVNCSYSNGIFKSSAKVFGIKQTLTLNSVTKVYFRFLYKALTRLQRVVIGIQNGDTLYINEEYPRQGIEKHLSIVENIKDKVTVHIMFESLYEESQVEIRRPLLVDNSEYRYTIKYKLDNIHDYRKGHTYKNDLGIGDFSNQDIWKVGGTNNYELFNNNLIVKNNSDVEIKIKPNLEECHLYLFKCLYKSINDLGSVELRNTLSIGETTKEQVWLLFKAVEEDELTIKIKNNSNLESIISFEKIMLIDLNKQKLNLKLDDIERLPYC